MNKVILIGRLIKDPDVRMGTNNTTIARYTLAVERQYLKNNERTSDFINCVALGKNVGSWQTGNYTDKGGKKVYTNDCLVETHEFAESKKSQPEEQSQPPVPSPEQDTSGFMDMPSIMDDELPFN